MRLRKSTWFISIGSLVISLIWLFIKQQLSFTHVSDILFLFTLFFLIVGVFLWVCSSGAFDVFQYSFKKTFGKSNDSYLKLSDIGQSSTRFWLEPGIILLILSLLALAIALIIK